MKIVKGKYNEAKIYASVLESKAEGQIKEMCNSKIMEDCKISIMPDVHYGKGVPIGTTIKLNKYMFPTFTGVDIGCGVSAQKIIAPNGFNFEKLQEVINEKIPSGFNHRDLISPFATPFEQVLNGLYAKEHVSDKKALLSLGTLGGGNHFISIEQSPSQNENEAYLLVHSGSRGFGYNIARYYEKIAKDELNNYNLKLKQTVIDYCKTNNKENEIEDRLQVLKDSFKEDIPFLSDIHINQFINDMIIAANYAQLNREIIIEDICNGMEYEQLERIDTIHNYIGKDMILRKGAVSARQGEIFILPINMFTGSLICVGKGNEEWNYSAPHGAGRLMSRTKAKENLDIEVFKKQAEGIWTESVGKEYIDEAPGAYKSLTEILIHLTETARVKEMLKPLFNFKSK